MIPSRRTLPRGTVGPPLWEAAPLTSPASDLLVRRGDSTCGPVVERPDGSHRRCLPDLGIYAVAAWSPDGRKLLVMKDVSGWHFTMFAVSVDAPFTHVQVVEHVRVPNSHTWPGRGDVAWQPRPTK